MENVFEQAMPFLTVYGLRVIGAIAILLLGRFGAGLARRLVKRVLTRTSVDPGVVTFAGSVAYVLVLVFAVIASLAKFGVETTSFVAILGAMGFAVGFALQGSLSNFAAGVLLLVLRPYRTGDVIEAAGVIGKVSGIQLFTTVLNTPDNVRILVPNSKVYGDVIKNLTANPTRRVDLVIGVGYGSPLDKTRKILAGVLSDDERVLSDPAPAIAVAELSDFSVNFVVRPWVKKEDYWPVKFDLTEKIKLAFDKNDIEIPFPTSTVHMMSAD